MCVGVQVTKHYFFFSVILSLLQFDFPPTGLGGPAGYLQGAHHPDSSQLPRGILPNTSSPTTAGTLLPPPMLVTINSPKPLQPLKPSRPWGCPTSKRHLAKVVAVSGAHDVTLTPEVSLLWWREHLCWRPLPTSQHVIHPTPGGALHTTWSAVYRGPAYSHTLLQGSQKWWHVMSPSIWDILVKKSYWFHSESFLLGPGTIP